jgi:hypothetical protein
MTIRADLRTTLARSGPLTGERFGPGTGDRFGGLLLVLVITYVLSAFTSGDWVSAVQAVLFLIVVLLALRTGRLQRRILRVVGIGLVAGSVVAAVLQLAAANTPAAGVANLWTALVLLVAIVMIVRRVLARPEITLQSIYGAISAYMILGLMFAAIYSALSHFDGNMFFAHGRRGNAQLFQYFSFTTLTTLGYGDYTAANSDGQAIAVLEAMAGQIFLATLVARLVAGFRGTSRLATRRATNRPAGARRASAKRATWPGMVRLRPPGTGRPRPGSVPRAAVRPSGRTGTGPHSPPTGPEPVPRRGSGHD